MSGRHQKAKPFSGSQLFRFGEYLLFLAIIPGTILAYFTGQYVFAMSPITAAAWLNLLRRSDDDRANHQRSVQFYQTAIQRFESISEVTQQERADFLMNHAGQITERDHLQYLQVLLQRVGHLEQNQESLDSDRVEYLRRSTQELAVLQAQHAKQQEKIEPLFHRFNPLPAWDADCCAAVREQCHALSSRVEQLHLQVASFDPASADLIVDPLQERLTALQSSVTNLEQVGVSVDVDLMPVWEPINSALVERLDSLTTHLEESGSEQSSSELKQPSLSERVESMAQRLSLALTAWDELTREAGYTVQRLQDQLQRIELELQDKPSPRINALETLTTQVIAQCSKLDVVESKVNRELEVIQRKLVDLNLFCDSFLSLELLQSSLDLAIAQAVEKIQRVAQDVEQNGETDLLQAASQSLTQQLSEYEHKLMEQVSSSEAIAAQLGLIESRMKTMCHNLEAHPEVSHQREAELAAVHVHLSMMRIKLEELNTQIGLSLQQVPYLVESHIRHKFSPHEYPAIQALVMKS